MNMTFVLNILCYKTIYMLNTHEHELCSDYTKLQNFLHAQRP